MEGSYMSDFRRDCCGGGDSLLFFFLLLALIFCGGDFGGFGCKR